MRKNAPFGLYLNCSLLVQHSPSRGRPPLNFTTAPQKPLRRNKEIRKNLSTVRFRYINEVGGVSLLRGCLKREIKEINDTTPPPSSVTRSSIRSLTHHSDKSGSFSPFRTPPPTHPPAPKPPSPKPPHGSAIAIVTVERNRQRPALRIAIWPIVIKAWMGSPEPLVHLETLRRDSPT